MSKFRVLITSIATTSDGRGRKTGSSIACHEVLNLTENAAHSLVLQIQEQEEIYMDGAYLNQRAFIIDTGRELSSKQPTPSFNKGYDTRENVRPLA